MPDFPYIGQALTPAEFSAYVAHYRFGTVPPDFIVFHHTAIPAASWAPAGNPGDYWDAGELGMSAAQIKAKRLARLGKLRDYYRDTLGWSAGPHLFIDDRYIYLFTPMYNLGIHAKWGNSFHQGGKLHYSIGIEVIGDYTRVQWPTAVQTNVRAAVQTLQQRLGTFTLDYLYATSEKPGRATRLVNGALVEYCPHPERLRFGGLSSHRDYNKPSCPGTAITEAFYLQVVRDSGTPAAPAGGYTADSPILGAPLATLEQTRTLMLGRAHGEYTTYDIGQVILPAYWRVATAVGLDPVLAIAQLIHETQNLASFWAARPRRNPAGIGVTGQAGVGVRFADWAQDSVPAHVGRLLAYAVQPRQSTAAQAALIQKALSYRPLPAAYRGVAPTLRGLNGRWAYPGTTYADKLAAIANTMRGL